ncbi:hypothetical protein HMPREF1214_03000 [Bacteroides sp. HPS0048]|nr:hypothetical protein HMPREF1214_03000 [Bacteroides sp. HPS0048]
MKFIQTDNETDKKVIIKRHTGYVSHTAFHFDKKETLE